MIAKLEYNLPEEKDSFLMAYNGTVFFSVLHGLEEQLRLWAKQGHNFNSVEECLDEVRKQISYGIEMQDELCHNPNK